MDGHVINRMVTVIVGKRVFVAAKLTVEHLLLTNSTTRGKNLINTLSADT